MEQHNCNYWCCIFCNPNILLSNIDVHFFQAIFCSSMPLTSMITNTCIDLPKEISCETVEIFSWNQLNKSFDSKSKEHDSID
jgi:hypothetical protein